VARTQNAHTYTDEELLKAYRNEASPEVLEDLLGRYVRFVFLVCNKYLRDQELAKDMSMQVFEKVMTDITRFEIQNFKSWLHVVAKNACLMHLRAEKGKVKVDMADAKEWERIMENPGLTHHEYDEKREVQLQQLEQAISELEEGQRQCVELFYLQERSYAEVSETTGYSLNQVKSHIQNGKRNLRNLLVGRGDVLLVLFLRLIS
jgi:RNA polymerase sigma factor (sigma-70 family)